MKTFVIQLIWPGEYPEHWVEPSLIQLQDDEVKPALSFFFRHCFGPGPVRIVKLKSPAQKGFQAIRGRDFDRSVIFNEVVAGPTPAWLSLFRDR